MDPEVLRALLSVLSKKGGLDLSSALGDPYLAYIAGSYQPEPVKSEGDIYAEFAPTLMSVADTEPVGSWRQTAASSIASGVPAYRVKEDVLRIASENPDALGLTTTDEASRFIDELAAENQRAQNELTKQAERKDPFQKAGFPGANQVFTPEDVVNMNPDLFAGIVNRQIPSELKNRMDAIREYGKKTVMREQTVPAEVEKELWRGQTGLDKVLFGNQPNYRIRRDARDVFFDPTQDTARTLGQILARADLAGGKNYAGGIIQERPLSYTGGLIAGLGEYAFNLGKDILGGSEGQSKAEQKILDREIKRRTKVDAEGKPVKVVSKSATQALRRDAEEAAKIVSRMKGGEEYNQRVAAAMAERLSQRMAESGRTPLSDALIRTAIVSRQLRK